jgi:outer membrane protein TolC
MRYLAALLLLLTPFTVFGQSVPTIKLRLADQEAQAKSTSARLAAAEHDAAAASFRAKAQGAQLYPRFALEGSYRYISEVPALPLPVPGGLMEKLGDNNNYSIGPAAYWTLWDGGNIRNAYYSALAAARAKAYDADGTSRQIELSVRSAYFQLALAGEQVVLYADALRLSQNQYNDIRVQAKAGNKSRKDALSAHQDVLARQKQLSQAQADMALSLRDLSALTGVTYGGSCCIPVDARALGILPQGIVLPTVSVGTEPLDALLARFMPYRSARVWENHPNLASLTQLAASARLAAASARENLWPKVQVSAKSSIDYPNGPIIESINQNSFGATLNWPLFEAGASRDRANDSREQERAALLRRDQQETDFQRDWDKTTDQLVNLAEQRRLSEEAAAESDELARITFTSYQSGAVTYIEVQDANYRALEAKIQLARTKVQMLMNLAVLASLAAPAQ